ncbi:hypothetical protein LTR66_014978, partial [Elasticomyces elasticus]
ALVDSAQVEVDFLAEHAAEVSDEVSLSSYEELVRACQAENNLLQKLSEFGSLDYDLDRAADRLICITTLIRNFSFFEPNFTILGQPEVVQLFTRVIQYMGTKDTLLRTSKNTLDFTKDIVIYLSNLSSSLQLPTKHDTLCLMHFLTSFAPQPAPTLSSEGLSFATYSPAIHKYLPPAVDSLTKLLARDEPNRGFFKSTFGSDRTHELLTKAFALTISAIPHSMHTSSAQLRAQIEARKPFLLQGLLAAEALASFVPGPEQNVARSWLQSQDFWAGNLLKIAGIVSALPAPKNAQRNAGRDSRGQPQPQDDDPLAHNSLANRAMALLRLLVAKSRITSATASDADMSEEQIEDTLGNGIPSSVVLKRETFLMTMLSKDMDASVLQGFCSYAALEDGS